MFGNRLYCQRDCQVLDTGQDPKVNKTGLCPLGLPGLWTVFFLEASKGPWGVMDVVQ